MRAAIKNQNKQKTSQMEKKGLKTLIYICDFSKTFFKVEKSVKQRSSKT